MAADPLSLLREYTKASKQVVLDGDFFVFGDVRVPRNTPTNYKAKSKANTYTLDAIWFFWQNNNLQHKDYVRECQKQGLALISFVDRKDIVAFLTGDADADKAVVKTKKDKREKRTDDDWEQKKKRAKTSELVDLVMDDQLEASKKVFASLLEKVGQTKGSAGVAEYEKLLSATGDHLLFAEAEQPISADIVALERTGRTRVTCLQSTKVFEKILTLFNDTWNAEKAAMEKGQVGPAARPNDGAKKTETRSRYNVPEAQVWKDAMGAESDLLKHIDPNQSFFNAGNVADPKAAPSRSSGPEPKVPSSKPEGGVSGPFIIIVPSALTSLITMHNAQQFLEGSGFLSPMDVRKTNPVKPAEVSFQRKRKDGTTITFNVIDNAKVLKPNDWARVVAVFTTGKVWEFNSFKWKTPADIFTYTRGYHMMYDDDKADATIRSWNVYNLKISKTKRHMDKSNYFNFWADLEKFMVAKKNVHCM